LKFKYPKLINNLFNFVDYIIIINLFNSSRILYTVSRKSPKGASNFSEGPFCQKFGGWGSGSGLEILKQVLSSLKHPDDSNNRSVSNRHLK